MSYPEWQEKYLESEKINGDVDSKKGISGQRQLEIRTAEAKAFYAKTDSNFGFKKMKGSPLWSKELSLVNDISVGLERQINCQRCVVAFEARMRGFDVMSRPSYGLEDTLRTNRQWLSAFNYSVSDIKKANGKTAEEMINSIEKVMRDFGEGSRAVIWFQWDKSKIHFEGGHVVAAECTKGSVVNFADPQVGSHNAKNKLKFALSGTVGILRVDNLAFTDVVKRCCMNYDNFG